MKFLIDHSHNILGKELALRIELTSGERVALVGPNGAGKSTWLKSLKSAPRDQFWSFLDQGPMRVLGELSGADLASLMEEHYFNLWNSEHFFEHLNDFSLSDILERPINILSGGENQTLKICFALSFKTNFFLFDEPLNNLDEKKQEIFFQKLKPENAYLFVEHKRSFIKAHCTHLISFGGNEKREVGFMQASEMLKVMTEQE